MATATLFKYEPEEPPAPPPDEPTPPDDEPE